MPQTVRKVIYGWSVVQIGRVKSARRGVKGETAAPVMRRLLIFITGPLSKVPGASLLTPFTPFATSRTLTPRYFWDRPPCELAPRPRVKPQTLGDTINKVKSLCRFIPPRDSFHRISFRSIPRARAWRGEMDRNEARRRNAQEEKKNKTVFFNGTPIFVQVTEH